MPARKQSPKDAAADLDDLLAPEQPEEQDFVLEEAIAPVEAEETDDVTPEEAAEMARLEALLSVPLPEPAEPKYVPYDQLTPAQKKIRDLKDAVARRDAEAAERAPVEYDVADSGGIMIHVLEDGFTACGVVWYRGQEIRFTPGGEAYEQTKNRDGESWLDLDEAEQWERWGKKMFGRGPWPGKKWGDTSGLSDKEEIAAATAAAAREARRKAAAPIIRA